MLLKNISIKYSAKAMCFNNNNKKKQVHNIFFRKNIPHYIGYQSVVWWYQKYKEYPWTFQFQFVNNDTVSMKFKCYEIIN